MTQLDDTPARADKSRLLTLPNALSLGRLLLGLSFPWIVGPWRFAAIVAAAVSDALDGLLSRATQTSSITGRFLDPVADKVFVIAALITFVMDGTLTVGQLALIALRDIAVLLCAAWALTRSGWAAAELAHPTWLGKLTTPLQMLALLVVLLWQEATSFVIVPVAVVSGLAGLDYCRRAWVLRTCPRLKVDTRPPQFRRHSKPR
jgi:phosphatidylglycerophosphate synthase